MSNWSTLANTAASCCCWALDLDRLRSKSASLSLLSLDGDLLRQCIEFTASTGQSYHVGVVSAWRVIEQTYIGAVCFVFSRVCLAGVFGSTCAWLDTLQFLLFGLTERFAVTQALMNVSVLSARSE